MEILKIVIWPALILSICVLFRKAISALIMPNQNQTMTVKVSPSGIEIQKIAAAAAAVATTTVTRADKENPVDSTRLAANLAQGIESSINFRAKNEKTALQKRLLWVDDNPANNKSLWNEFRNLGIDVVLSTTTESAKSELSATNFDLIITDMSRPPDEEAGLSLIKYLREQKIEVPTIIYAAFWASKHLGKEDDFGAKLITNDPSQVYATVLKNLLNAS